MDNSIVLHIPHSSTLIPKEILSTFLLSSDALSKELLKMTDLYTNELFTGNDKVTAPVSRLVCDVERFRDDKYEPMSDIGMGAVYKKTSTDSILRNISEQDKEYILMKYYDKHHKLLEGTVNDKIKTYGKCFIVDCHSFGDELDYIVTHGSNMPDFCIGTDDFHTPIEVVKAIRDLIKTEGYSVKVNFPFKGALVPLSSYKTNKLVSSIMIEVNKRLYLNTDGTKNSQFKDIKNLCSKIINTIISIV